MKLPAPSVVMMTLTAGLAALALFVRAPEPRRDRPGTETPTDTPADLETERWFI